MSDVVNAELLRLCDDLIANPLCWADAKTVARALKSRLQAERQGVHEVCSTCGLDTRKATTECPSWHGLAIDAPCFPSQAEAQAPTTHPLSYVGVLAGAADGFHKTAASVLTEDELREMAIWRKLPATRPVVEIIDRLLARREPASNVLAALDQFAGRTCADCPIPELRIAAEDDLTSTVGAPAPVPTREQIYSALSVEARKHGSHVTDYICSRMTDAILALFAKGDTNV